MNTEFQNLPVKHYRQYTVWLITILVLAFGFQYLNEIIAFVLDKLYQVFIQQNPANI